MIKEITGYLKIVRSVPLKSLNFLKNLKIIHGQTKYFDTYSLYILDNANLEDLWHDNSSLKIASGKVFFHYNPKLCLDKIYSFVNTSKPQASDEKDISVQSNGNRASCVVSTLNITIIRVDAEMAIIEWTNFLTMIDDQRSLLGYLLSYREAPHQNLSIFDDQDACSTDSWKIIDVPAHQNDYRQPVVTDMIVGLKSYTQYAVYVKTYTVSSEKKGGQSNIIYFKTSPTKPTSPVGVKVVAVSSSKLAVNWKSPNSPNGLITQYIVEWIRKEDSQDFLDMRNYCKEPLTKVDSANVIGPGERKETFLSSSISSTAIPEGGQCCSCPKPRQQLERDEAERQFEIEFENFLHNTVYIRRREDWEDESINASKLIDHVAETNDEDEFTRRIRRETMSKAEIYGENTNGRARILRYENALPNILSSFTPSPKDVKLNSVIDQTNRLNKTISATSINKELFTNNSFRKIVTSNVSLSLEIDGLKHFSEYVITVIACQDMTKIEASCSGAAIGTARTKHAPLVDDIDSNSVNVDVQNKSNAVLIRWKIPPQPNGLILLFQVEIECKDKDTLIYSNQQCITHKDYIASNGYIVPGLLSGNYSLRIRATSLAGHGNWTTAKYFYIPESSSNLSLGLIVGIVVIVMVVLLSVFGGVTYYVKKRLGSRVPGIMYASVNPEYLSNMYVPDEWEISREKITILKELGQGSFGMVYEGKVKDVISDLPFVRCAVKTVNDSATLRERIEFLNEASVMKSFSCHHVVRLLGVVSKGQPTLVVMELMANGDLKSYLRSHRPDADENSGRQPPTLKRMLHMAIEIADGMAYLSAQKYVHRDLAARNCMVSENLTVKIGDFGMTRDIYETDYYRKGGKGLLPVRWMAPESLKDGIFTSQSDVWSYGIVIWEMATLASQPYQGLSNEQVLKYVIDGGIMEKPENCPDRLYDLMRNCFHYNPKLRPNFVQLIRNLLPDASPNFAQVAFYFNGHNGESDSGGNPRNERSADLDDVCEEEVLPSTPLRSPQEENTKDGNYVLDDDGGSSQKSKSSYIRHFRLPSKLQSKHHHHRHHSRSQPPLVSSFPQPVVVPSVAAGAQSKGLPTNSSDGSKASACSANGSLLNGHVGVPLSINRTAEC
ncbi:hypothetical protein CHUAL_000605 [Chamberlinius hualienensis]